jgi:hypothetical protein
MLSQCVRNTRRLFSDFNPLNTTKETVVSNTKYGVESASTISPGFRGVRLLEWSAMWIWRH